MENSNEQTIFAQGYYIKNIFFLIISKIYRIIIEIINKNVIFFFLGEKPVNVVIYDDVNGELEFF